MKRERGRGGFQNHFQNLQKKNISANMQFQQQGHCTMSQPGIPDQVLQHLNHIRYSFIIMEYSQSSRI